MTADIQSEMHKGEGSRSGTVGRRKDLRPKLHHAAIAQLGERETEDLKVPSSILGLGSIAGGAARHFCCPRSALSSKRGLCKKEEQTIEIQTKNINLY